MDVRTFRKSLGLTQTELGERLGVTQGTISKWEAGVRTLSRRDVLALEAVGTQEAGTDKRDAA